MIVDLFAGPGGWDEGLAVLGRTDVVGIEINSHAVDVAEAAHHKRMHADVRQVPTSEFSDVEGLIASPPCQTFSLAGRRPGVGTKGGRSVEALAQALSWVAAGASCEEAAQWAGLDSSDPRSVLVLEPMRFIRDCDPAWVACEQVPAVLPVWETYATILEYQLGYSTWAGRLNAADYGVPQARKRAFLLATRDGNAAPPVPTHAENPGPVGLFETVKPWVTMAEALDLGERPTDATQWAWDRPATTVVRTFDPDVISAPGYRRKGDPPRQKTPGSIRVSLAQLCILQGIRTNYPFHVAPKSKRANLIGAILPPPWAMAILEPLIVQTSLETVCVACGNDDASYGHRVCLDCLEAGAD